MTWLKRNWGILPFLLIAISMVAIGVWQEVSEPPGQTDIAVDTATVTKPLSEVVEQLPSSGNTPAKATEQLPAWNGQKVLEPLKTNPILWAIGVVAFVLLVPLFWKRPSWGRLLLFGGVAAALTHFFFTGDLQKWEWATTPLGAYLVETYSAENVERAMWFLLFVVGVVVWNLLGSKTSDSDKARTESDPVGAFFGLIIILVVGTVAIGATGVVVMIAEEATDASEKLERYRSGTTTPTPEERDCATNKTSINWRIDKGGRDVKVCRDVAGFYLLPEYGHRLVFEVAPEYERFVKDRSLEYFVTIQQPGTFHGSTAESYRISPNTVGSAFDKSDLEEFVLYVKAVK